MRATHQPLCMVGCGILQKEVDYLIKKNGWNVETRYLDSSLHNYLGRLHDELDGALTEQERQGVQPVVFYGACHPKMSDLLAQHHTHRTEGQNCIVMLLGYAQFMHKLGQGAYFLLEEWALTWEPMLIKAFGANLDVVREIFRGSHKEMMAIRTPCSADFTQAAEAAARFVDLPLSWMEVNLDHLEQVLHDALINCRREGS